MLFKDYTPYSDSSALADVSERSYFLSNSDRQPTGKSVRLPEADLEWWPLLCSIRSHTEHILRRRF